MASTGLSKTFSAGNRKTFTWSGWVKRSKLSSDYFALFSSGTYPDLFQFMFNTSTDELRVLNYDSAATTLELKTNAVYRDTSAWYHIVLAVDTTQATSSDRAKLYVNGEQITSLATATYPSQNADLEINLAQSHSVGYRVGHSDYYFDGSMAHVHFIDGTAYDADTFGETDSTTGIWKPKTAPSVTYGTNGFFLKFENSGAFGTDSSGNGNNFTVNGTMTQTIDTPSNVFATLNPLSKVGSGTFSNGNNTLIYVNDTGTASTLGVSKGKWYWEYKFSGAANVCHAGVIDASIIPTVNINNTGTAGYYPIGNSAYKDTTQVTTGLSGYSDGMIVGCAFDADNGDIYTWVNGVAENSGNAIITGLDTTKTWLVHAGTGGTRNDLNFGNGYFGTTAVSSAENPDDGIGIFEYDVPAGYRALCTKSINAEEYS